MKSQKDKLKGTDLKLVNMIENKLKNDSNIKNLKELREDYIVLNKYGFSFDFLDTHYIILLEKDTEQ